ncbi:uncharacterized protein LOC141912160 [Tubulanus polymorphus]|uniref:uncharacterized protein LOC141912160 n=1 Tax=Tubulanus polymorphus TaxID=672921 RepID=UPI003DA21D90
MFSLMQPALSFTPAASSTISASSDIQPIVLTTHTQSAHTLSTPFAAGIQSGYVPTGAVGIHTGANDTHSRDGIADINFNDFELIQPDTPTIQFRVQTSGELSQEEINRIEREEYNLLVRRTAMVEDMINAFCDASVMGKIINARMILPNGNVEAGEGHGVFRECLTEFWSEFRKQCMTGSSQMIPLIRHDYGTEKWEAVGRIISKGFQETSYFPIFLAQPFVSELFFQQDDSVDLVESFLKYVSPSEELVFRRALANFDDEANDVEEIIDILGGYECRKLPTKENFSMLIREISHQELVQKPRFIVDCIKPMIQKYVTISYKQYLDLCTDLKPSCRKVVELLSFPNVLSAPQSNVATLLKRYVRSLDESMLSKFLRYCTGSDICNCQKIDVTFTKVDGLQRAPVARTCAQILELPETYDEYVELKQEFDNILQSNVWVMDVV